MESSVPASDRKLIRTRLIDAPRQMLLLARTAPALPKHRLVPGAD
jgi:hypothetical protein